MWFTSGRNCRLENRIIRFYEQQIKINQTLQYNKEHHKNKLQTPKNREARKIGIPDTLVKELKEYTNEIKKLKLMLGPSLIKNLDDEGNAINFLFIDIRTGLVNSTKSIQPLRSRFIKEKSNLDCVNFHGLRHSCATYLIKQGVPINIVQKQLGHANMAMTLNMYTHKEVEDMNHLTR